MAHVWPCSVKSYSNQIKSTILHALLLQLQKKKIPTYNNVIYLFSIFLFSEVLVDLAANKPAWQSSMFADLDIPRPASMAVDQDLVSYHHTNNDVDAWLAVDLGSPEPVRAVLVDSRNGKI